MGEVGPCPGPRAYGGPRSKEPQCDSSFYPRDAMRIAGLCDSDVSVRPTATVGILSKRKRHDFFTI